MNDLPVYYFTTANGLVAVSLDDGVTILLPTGRNIAPTEVWEEVDDDLEDRLNEVQKKALDEFRSKPLTTMERIVRDLTKNRSLQARHFRQPGRPHKVLSEDAVVVKSSFDD